jgi:hypothetical protein
MVRDRAKVTGSRPSLPDTDWEKEQVCGWPQDQFDRGVLSNERRPEAEGDDVLVGFAAPELLA